MISHDTKYDYDVDKFVDWFDRLSREDQLTYLTTEGEGPRYNHQNNPSAKSNLAYREALAKRSREYRTEARERRRAENSFFLKIWDRLARRRWSVLLVAALVFGVVLFMPDPGLQKHLWTILRVVLLSAIAVFGGLLFFILDPNDKDPFEPIKEEDMTREDILARVLLRDERYLTDKWIHKRTGLSLEEFEELAPRERKLLEDSGVLTAENLNDLRMPPTKGRNHGGARRVRAHENIDGSPKKVYKNFAQAVDALRELENKYRLERFSIYLCEDGNHWHVGHASNY